MSPKLGRARAGSAHADQLTAELAGQSHGVVTRRELLAAGVSPAQIKQRISRGSLITVHRGVYHAGHGNLTFEARYTAAVKACGERAIICDLAAGYLWGLLKGAPPPPAVLAPHNRAVPGLLTHRGTIHRGDVSVRQGIPVTSVPRTVVDLAGSLSEAALARAVHEAQVRYRTTPRHVEAVLGRRRTSRGAATLRAILRGDTRVTLSALESRFLDRLREARLPLPQANVVAGRRRVDCRWPDRRLTVELDGYRYHASRHAWERDRLREREARARGDEFRRYSYADVFENPESMLAELRDLLGGHRVPP